MSLKYIIIHVLYRTFAEAIFALALILYIIYVIKLFRIFVVDAQVYST